MKSLVGGDSGGGFRPGNDAAVIPTPPQSPRSLGLRAPDDAPKVTLLSAAPVRRHQVLGGQLNEYHNLPPRMPHHPQETPSSAA
ncbi:hypothetical protein EEJ42_07610 [Streptomyces botrytidirepellens]|uniref:Uncharacterized protein n=1 Tax=Streptomyces botrytidirepellens TaxID=2486417 RepID=A0A3M8WSF9_9ACTN|nr:hypothetical protein EEJ42_07610 [Streptomyces botrytidirepellens]